MTHTRTLKGMWPYKTSFMLSIIVAVADNGAIGHDLKLLWHLPGDMKRFKELTTGHTVIMGRNTYESLPKGALPNRKNIVLTRQTGVSYPGCTVFHSLEEALASCNADEKVYLIGGASVYEAGLKIADRIDLTRVYHHFPAADTFFPDFRQEEWVETERQDFPADEKHAYPFSFFTFVRK